MKKILRLSLFILLLLLALTVVAVSLCANIVSKIDVGKNQQVKTNDDLTILTNEVNRLSAQLSEFSLEYLTNYKNEIDGLNDSVFVTSENSTSEIEAISNNLSIMNTELKKIDANVQKTKDAIESSRNIDGEIIEAQKAISIGSNLNDDDLKKIYYLNAFYHDPNSVTNALRYYSLLDPIVDYSEMMSFTQLLQTAMLQVDASNVGDLYTLYQQCSSDLANLVKEEDNVLQNADSDDYYHSEYMQEWNSSFIDGCQNLAEKTVEDYTSGIEAICDSLISKYNKIKNPVAIDKEYYDSMVELLTLTKCLESLNNLSKVISVLPDEEFVDLYRSVEPYISQLLYQGFSFSADGVLGEQKSICIKYIRDIKKKINDISEEKVLSYLKDCEQRLNLLEEYDALSKTPVQNKARYDSIIEFNYLISEYEDIGTSAYFKSVVADMYQLVSKETIRVEQSRYNAYQEWAAKVLNTADQWLKNAGKGANKLILLGNSNYFKINPQLLTYQLQAYYNSFDLENFRKNQPDLFSSYCSSAQKGLEDF